MSQPNSGRFAPGNPGGPGNPFARQVAAFRKSLLGAITGGDLEEIARTLIKKAKDGDVPAARLLLGYALGKPTPANDPDKLDIQEWQGFKETANMLAETPELVVTPSPELPLAIIRESRPAMVREHARRYLDIQNHPEKHNVVVPDLKIVEDPPSPNGVFGNEHLARLRVAEPSANGKK